MTKVIAKIACLRWITLLVWAISVGSFGQGMPSGSAATTPIPSAAEKLYRELRSAGLDQTRVYNIREAAIDRPPLHITMDDGTIAFTEDVMGRVTGAFFEGDGEVLLMPPNKTERASMSLFTGAAILEERFGTGYFRFNDATFAELQPYLRPAEEGREFAAHWNETARNLAQTDGLRLLLSFSQFLPVSGKPEPAATQVVPEDDRMFHARVQGNNLGAFDVYYDTAASEQIWAGQTRTVESGSYYDVWASFPIHPSGRGAVGISDVTEEGGQGSAITIPSYNIRTHVKPPSGLEVEAQLDMEVNQGGQRTVLFELSRFLEVQSVEADGKPIDFIHNESIEGSDRARRGNDLLAAIFPEPLRTGQKIKLRFAYRGDVLSEAGGGLLYVGARGTWYPNRGIAMSNYELEFHSPPGWTLVATGKRVGKAAPVNETSGEEVTRWVSERPIPIAGFNLGKYARATTHAGDVAVETFAAMGVERSFPKLPQSDIITPPPNPLRIPQSLMVTPLSPSPARNAQAVADASAQALEFFSRKFGPYPYSSLSLTQIPGDLSQGWPGLIFLSTYSFLTNEERTQLHMSNVERIASNVIVAHETAHQWWGDLVVWSSYRDQWIIEALANYSAMMLLETQDPSKFQALLDKYREELLKKNKEGQPLMDAGAVTLGTRLSSSHFPNGYTGISYGRGTWLFHMLRGMLQEAEKKSAGHPRAKNQTANDNNDELFLRILQKVRQQYEGKALTTRELLHVFEEELPPSLWYEGKKSLDWFYEGWINGTAIPQFDLQKVKYGSGAGSTTVSGVIRQQYADQGVTSQELVTPVPVYALSSGKPVLLGQVFVEGTETPFRLTAPAGTRKIVLDPNQTLLARPH